MEPKKIMVKIKSERRDLEGMSVRMRKETVDILRKAAEELGVSVGAVIRVITDEFAEQWQKSHKPANNSQD